MGVFQLDCSLNLGEDLFQKLEALHFFSFNDILGRHAHRLGSRFRRRKPGFWVTLNGLATILSTTVLLLRAIVGLNSARKRVPEKWWPCSGLCVFGEVPGHSETKPHTRLEQLKHPQSPVPQGSSELFGSLGSVPGYCCLILGPKGHGSGRETSTCHPQLSFPLRSHLPASSCPFPIAG